MVSDRNASSTPTVEWRRRFRGMDPLWRVLLAVAAAGVAVVLGILAASATHLTTAVALLGAAVAAVGASVAYAISSQTLPGPPHSVYPGTTGITVGSRIRDQHILGGYITSAGLTIAFGGILFAVRTGDLPDVPAGVQIGSWVALALLLASFAHAVYANPFRRHLVFRPDALILHLGDCLATIPWESIRSIETWEGRSANALARGMYDGIAISADGRASFTRLVPWPTTRPEHHLLGGLTVDADTLYNAIVALHEHPELRPLVGTPEGAVLFEGPPRAVRQRMQPDQAWEPWGQRIHAMLVRRKES